MSTQRLIGIEALGYIGVRAKDLGDWASYGTNFLGLQRIDKSRSTLAFRMDDRKQRLVVDADGGEGIGFFGWEVADAAALDAIAARIESGRHQGGARLARARRRAARQGPDRAQRSGRQPARNLPRRRDHHRSVQARPQHFRLPHRSARHGPCGDAFRAHRRGDDVLSGRARVQAQRLLAASVPGLLLPRQSAPSQHRVRRERHQHGPSHDGGALQLRRRRAKATISRSASRSASASRSVAIPATTSPRSTPGIRRASWSSTAGAAS